MKFKLISLSIFCACSTFAQADMYQESTFDAVDFFDDFYGSEEMVAIATGMKTQIYKAPAVASVFTAEQIKNMGATDIDDVLEAVPGLHISRSANGYNPLYTFRGVHSVYNQQILMLINNIPITNSFAGNRNQTWGGMPVEAIARIEVIRGPGSAIYGADAFAGVINIITKNADDIKKNELSVRAGSDNTQNAWFTLGGNIGEVKYATIVEYHNTDGSDKVIEQDSQTLNDSLHGTKVSNAPGAINIPVESFDVRSEINWADFTLRAGLQKRRKGIAAGLGEALDPTSSQQSIRWNVDVNYYKQVIERLADISSDTARGGLSAKPNNEAGRVNALIEFALREFELSYLRLLGYGIDLLHCAGDGQKIKSGFFYRLDPQQGFLRIETSSSNSAMKASLECIPGHVLLAIAAGTYHDKQALLFAKLICREFFKPMLADKPLRSRELFV